MEEVKKLIAENDKEGLKKPLADKTPEFCGQALFYAVQKGVNDLKKEHINSSKECIAHYNKELVQIFLDCGADVNVIITEGSARGYSTFGYACLVANADIVKLLLDSKADLTLKDNHGRLPVQLAFSSKKSEVTDIFWQLGVNKNDVNDLGLLVYAVGSNSEEKIKKLLRMGADVDAVNQRGSTALHAAVLRKNLKLVELLVDSGANVNKFFDENLTPLELALMYPLADIVKYLLEHGADINLGGGNILTAAILSGENKGYEEIIKLLLEHGADINKRNKKGRTPAQQAALYGHAGILQLLMKLGAKCGNETMAYAILGNKIRVVEFLLEYGLVMTDHAIRTAVRCGHKEIVKLFLDRGAEQDDELVILAISGKFTEIVQLLLEYGMDAKAIFRGISAIACTVRGGNKEIVELLLNFGADVNQTSPELASKLPLHYAAIRGDNEIFQLLLDHGADINAVYDNETAMRILISKNHVHVAQTLVTRLVLVKATGMMVSEQNWSDVRMSDAVVKRKTQCEKELEEMRNKKFDDSSLSVFDICQSNDDLQLAAWTRNENIVKALKSDEILKKFPIYGHLLVENFKKGVLKNKDFQLFKRFAAYLSDRDHDTLPKLPSTVVSQLFNYLSCDDVAKLWKL